MTPQRIFTLAISGILGIFVIVLAFQTVVVLDAEKIMVIQYPTGSLEWFTTPGPHMQWFGKVTKYPRRAPFWFSVFKDQGRSDDQSMKIRFNDGAHANISGSLSYELPVGDRDALMNIHMKFGSPENLEAQLIRTVAEKAVYMTGPLMSSKESYSERRNQLISFIDDQIVNGVFQTRVKTIQDKDPMTGAPRTVSITELITGSDGKPLRQDESPITQFKIRIYNLSLNEVKYEDRVEQQIGQQQNAIQQVQLAIAQAKEAEQKAITAAKQGEANAATAKWEQEVFKAKAVTEAQQKLEVARLEVATAEQYKLKKIKEAEGDAEYKRKIIVADGALQQKLEAYTEVMKAFAESIGKQKWVPEVVMSGNDKTAAGGNATALIEMLSAKVAKDLALDMKVGGSTTGK